MASTFQNSVTTLQENVAQSRESISNNSTELTTNLKTQSSSLRDFVSHSSHDVGSLKKKVLKHELVDDISTSETPKKRQYQIPSSWPLTKPHDELISQLNKLPLSNVDINLTSQTPGPTNRVRNLSVEEVRSVSKSLEKNMVTPLLEKCAVVEKSVLSEGRENTNVFKSKLIAPSRKRTLGSH